MDERNPSIGALAESEKAVEWMAAASARTSPSWSTRCHSPACSPEKSIKLPELERNDMQSIQK